MSTEVENLRKRIAQFSFDWDDVQSNLCKHGQDFSDWVDGWLFPNKINVEPKAEEIYDALAMLVLKYYSYRGYAPKQCWIHGSDRGHTCLKQVLDQTAERLISLLNAQKPALYREPPRPLSDSEIQYVEVDPLIGFRVQSDD